ncbi:MAG: 3D domain-containing protein, partial [Nanoarchaeota archaeon]
ISTSTKTCCVKSQSVCPQGYELKWVTATAYCNKGCTAGGICVHKGTISVDIKKIDLGSRIIIPDAVSKGWTTKYDIPTEGRAEDTGGSIIGNRIDIWIKSKAKAYAWGRRYIRICAEKGDQTLKRVCFNPSYCGYSQDEVGKCDP